MWNGRGRALCTAALGLAAMLSVADAQEGTRTAIAEMHNRDGKGIGQVRLEDTPNGLLIVAELTDLPEGAHAFHIHAVGECEPPFQSAGGHLNLDDSQHGMRNDQGMHAGDLPNIHAGATGAVTVEVFAPGLSLAELFDDDGSAMVVHAGQDDYTTDPAGNAGDRIACGVVSR